MNRPLGKINLESIEKTEKNNQHFYGYLNFSTLGGANFFFTEKLKMTFIQLFRQLFIAVIYSHVNVLKFSKDP